MNDVCIYSDVGRCDVCVCVCVIIVCDDNPVASLINTVQTQRNVDQAFFHLSSSLTSYI